MFPEVVAPVISFDADPEVRVRFDDLMTDVRAELSRTMLRCFKDRIDPALTLVVLSTVPADCTSPELPDLTLVSASLSDRTLLEPGV